MRVLLLAMPNTAFFFHLFATLPNLGICSIAGNIAEEHEVEIADLVLIRRNFRKFLETRISKHTPDIVGLSSMSFQCRTARYIARVIKNLDPEIKVALGGYHASMMPEEVGRSWGADIDYIIKGEGEYTFRELLNALNNDSTKLREVPGLSFRKNGEFVHNPRRPIVDLTTLNLPNRSARLLKEGFHICDLKADVIETSRGCTYNCKFCSINKMYGRALRKYNITRVLDDIERCKKNGTKAIFFADDNITLDSGHFIDLCEGIVERELNDIHYTTQAHVGGLYNQKLINKAIDANFKAFFLGIENPDPEKLQKIGKSVKKMAYKAESVVSQLRSKGAIVLGGFIVGNPDDDAKDFNNILSYAKQIKVDAPIFFILTPYPGTRIRENLLDKNLVTNSDDFSKYDALTANIKTNYLSRNEVEILTESLYDKFMDFDWFLNTNIRRVYPWYFIKIFTRFIPRLLRKGFYKITDVKNYHEYLLEEIVLLKKEFRELQR
ncbi:MAG: B12-binding domain-containing radical SAM protein [Promethearchaeota archaeon]